MNKIFFAFKFFFLENNEPSVSLLVLVCHYGIQYTCYGTACRFSVDVFVVKINKISRL